MPIRLNVQRHREGPWVVVCVPVEGEDPLYPSSRLFYTGPRQAWSASIQSAAQFTVLKEARRAANLLMNYNKAVLAEVVPFCIAWALVYTDGVPWKGSAK